MPRNRYNRTAGTFRRDRAPLRMSSDAFLIVTEGEVTEPEYFEALVRTLRMSAIDVEVAPSTIGTDPMSIIEFAENLHRKRKRAARKDPAVVAYDQIWVVFDQEGVNNGRDWQNALHQAESKRFNVVFSNPSFEFWLLLHHIYTTASFTDSDSVERRLCQENTGYTKRRGQVDYTGTYIPKTEEAITHARRVRADHENTGATNPLTDADRLVIELNDAVQPHNRIFTHRQDWEAKDGEIRRAR